MSYNINMGDKQCTPRERAYPQRWFKDQILDGKDESNALPSEDKPDIVIIGSCMIDLVSYVPRLPKPGETIHGTKFNQGFGGKGANQCVAAAKLGASCALVAKLGYDSFGQSYLNELSKYTNINTTHVGRVNGVSSGMASICVACESGENQIVIVPGANETLCQRNIDGAFNLLKQAKVLVFQGETPWSTTRYCLEKIRVIPNVISVVNVAPAPSELCPDLLQSLKLATIVCVNEIEAELLTRVTPNTEPSFIECFARLRELGVRSSVVTLGGQGVVFSTEEDGTPHRVYVDEVKKPVDTTGAGDCFLGALAYYLSYFPSLAPAEQISRACRIAKLSVMQCGTQESFPSRCDLDEALFSKPQDHKQNS